MMDISSSDIERLLELAVADKRRDIGNTKTASAIQALIASAESIAFQKGYGHHHLQTCSPPSVDKDSIFDIASLTKPIVTATLVGIATEEIEHLSFETPLREILEFDSVTIEPEIKLFHLLSHSSGLPDWLPLFEEAKFEVSSHEARTQRNRLFREVASVDLEAAPGSRQEYSDLGYILLTAALEQIYGKDLDQLARSKIFEPLAMENTFFVSALTGESNDEAAVATELYGETGLTRGIVHDRNARSLGGVAGHAGLFSCAKDIHKIASHLVQIDSGELSDGILRAQTLRQMWDADIGDRFVLGWDTPTGSPSTAGRGFQAGSTVGHLGFTGTSLWIERETETIAVLLTNRVYPSRDNDLINDLRVQFHELLLPAPER